MSNLIPKSKTLKAKLKTYLLQVSIIPAFLMLLIAGVYPELNSGTVASRNIVIGFFAYNGYGNNLYLDNVRTGAQINYDVKVTSLLNIPYDTTYSVLQSGTDTITPRIGISNVGRVASADSIKIFLKIDPIGYFDSTKIAPIGSGVSIATSMDRITYPIGVPLYLSAYLSYDLDSNRSNDTLRQTTIVLPGYKRKVLFEEFTSNSSPSCANNNSYLNQFINNNFSEVCAIKYHLGFLGTDSFYIANPEGSDARRRYYYASAVPLTIADGKTFISIPYGDSVNLYNPFKNRQLRGTPIDITVTDERLGQGVIRSTAIVNILSPLKPGNYRLRFNAVERYRYDTLQGTNGESNFYDIFRNVFPDTNGIPISISPGTNQYSVTYNIDPRWRDTMIYTCAFIQNDADREVMNSAKSRADVASVICDKPNGISYKADLLQVDDVHYGVNVGETDSIQSSLIAELFEAFFPPIGWRIFNQDGFISYDQFTGANGPSIGGIRSVIMNFYDYNIPGQRDSMYSASYVNLFDSDTLRFDYAYAQYNATNIDSLMVKVSIDGGISFPYEVFRKGGLGLATAPQTSSSFVPQNNTEWRSFSFPLSGIVSATTSSTNIPGKFELHQNFPNPFNPSTYISFSLPVRSRVKLIVYDMLGREVRKLADNSFEPGNHKVVFDAADLSSGIYFYTISTPGFSSTKRMAFIK